MRRNRSRHLVDSDHFNQAIRPSVLPVWLRTLCFGPSFYQPIVRALLPRRLRYLSFKDTFSQPIEPDVFPSALQLPHLGYAFSQELPMGLFPHGLRVFCFGFRFDQPIFSRLLCGFSSLRIVSAIGWRRALFLPVLLTCGLVICIITTSLVGYCRDPFDFWKSQIRLLLSGSQSVV